MDLLSEILCTSELSSRLYFRAELTRPFSIAVPEADGEIRFHAALEGSCTIALPSGEALRFGPGDLVMAPYGAAHLLADAPGGPGTPLEEVLGGAGADPGTVVFGGGGSQSVLVCGHVAFAGARLHPVLASLPALVHVRADEAASRGWLAPLLGQLEREARLRRQGHREILRRLAEILFVEVLRTRADQTDRAALAALADPQLGRALEALHGAPDADWSLDRLARTAGLSRTLFTERFRDRMGMPPMAYLAQWRMQQASRMLSRGHASVAEVARRVGYASESAFHRVFRQHFGAAPGAWRRSHRAA